MVVSEIRDYAILTSVGYAKLLGSDGIVLAGTLLKTALKSADLTDEQITEFDKNYKVKTQYTDSTGFAVTVFETSGDPKQIVVVPRGTEPNLDDIGEDVAGVGGLGIAAYQGISLLNFLIRENANIGQAIFQYSISSTLDSLGNQLIAVEATKTFAGREGALGGQSFSTAGHSLGGHLALELSRLGGDQVGKVYTYNAPGFDTFLSTPGSEEFYRAVSQAQVAATGATTVASKYDADKVVNIETAGDVVSEIGTKPGATLISFDEPTSPLSAHSITFLAMSLQVQALLSKFYPSLDLQTLYEIFDSSSIDRDFSLEAVLTRLDYLLKGEAGRGGEIEMDNSSLSQLISTVGKAADDTLQGKNSAVKSLYGLGAQALVSLAHQDLAYLYSLYQASSFSVLGLDAIYGAEKVAELLRIYDDTTGIGSLTEKWVEDRAIFLSYQLEAQKNHNPNLTLGVGGGYDFNNVGDMAGVRSLGVYTSADVTKVKFGGTGDDSIGGTDGVDHLYGGHGNDVIAAGAQDDYVEGGTGDDRLSGGVGDDVLLGMSGDDLLDGGAGNDQLDGGVGINGYIFSSGDGIDVIADIDQTGYVVINGVRLTTANLVEGLGSDSRHWVTEQGYSLTLTSDGTMVVGYGSGDSIIINNFRPGGFSLAFDDSPTPEMETDTRISGDLSPLMLDGSYVYDVLGNIVVDPTQTDVGRVDLLYGSAGDDRILGGGGSDRLFGRDGNDYLYADQEITLAEAGDRELPGAARKGDLLDGGAGDDQIIGGDGRDFLAGGLGEDIIYGGEGSDAILGDGFATITDEDWEFSDDVTGQAVILNGYHLGYSFGDVGAGSNDIVYGQGGNDYIFVGAGSDFVDGGEGDDALIGESGNDTLIGGDGRDVIWGDQYDQVFADDDTGSALPSRFHGNDVIDGGLGNDYLYGGGGSDRIIGGEGDDFIEGDGAAAGLESDAFLYNGVDVIDGGSGDDYIQGGGRGDILVGGDGNDTLIGDFTSIPEEFQGDDVIYGGEGDDRIQGGAGADKLYGGAGDDEIIGDAGQQFSYKSEDDYIDGGEGDDIINAGGGNDTVFGGGGDDRISGDDEGTTLGGNDFIDGGAGNDRIEGRGGVDTLFGGAGDDVIIGGDDEVTFDGGTGRDLIVGGHAGDNYIFRKGNEIDIINDGGGKNTFMMKGVYLSQLTSRVVDVEGKGAGLALDTSNGDSLVLLSSGDFSSSTFVFSNNLTFSYTELLAALGVKDVVTHDNLPSSTIRGTIGDDQIGGTASADVILGRAGDDRLIGGEGDDTYVFYKNDGFDTIDDIEGNNSIAFMDGVNATEVQYSLGLGEDGVQYLNISYEGGTVRIKDAWYGNFSRIIYSSGEKISSTEIFANLRGINADVRDEGGDVIGSEVNDTLRGGVGADVIDGRSGDDFIFGGAGTDKLIGGLGNDVLKGGAGDDLLFGSDGDDVLSGGSGYDILDGGTGRNEYRFEKGMQIDKIAFNNLSFGTVTFSSSFWLEALSTSRAGKDLIISSRFGEDQLVVTGYFERPDAWSVNIGDKVDISMEEFRSLVDATLVGEFDPAQREYMLAVQAASSSYLVASGYTQGSEGTWVSAITQHAGDETKSYAWSYDETYMLGGVVARPDWMGEGSGGAVLASYSSKSDSQTKLPLIEMNSFDVGKIPAAVKYYKDAGAVVYDSANEQLFVLEKPSGELLFVVVPNEYSLPQQHLYFYGSVETKESTAYSIVHTDQTGGRLSVEGGNIVVAGDGDDTLVGYASIYTKSWYMDTVGPLGVFLSAGGGDDLLRGTRGSDYLISGSGVDKLYGLDGVDDYFISSESDHTIVADFARPYSADGDGSTSTGWSTEYGYLNPNDNDTITLMEGIHLDQLRLSWGTEAVEAPNVEIQRTGSGYAPFTNKIYSTLQVRWGNEHLLSVVMPSLSDVDKTGVEWFVFSDGTKLSMGELLARFSMTIPLSLDITGASLETTVLPLTVEENTDMPLLGTLGNDRISAPGTVFGLGGNDELFGVGTKAKLVGGIGDDILHSSSDVTVFEYSAQDDGTDTLLLAGYRNVVDFTSTGEPIVMGRDHDALVIRGHGQNVGVRISDYFLIEDHHGLEVHFIDEAGAEQSWDHGQIVEHLQNGVEADPPLMLFGSRGDNVLTGGGSNDTLIAFRGHDTLVGGLGNDIYSYQPVGDQSTAYIVDAGGEADMLLLQDVQTKSSFMDGIGKSDNDLVYTSPTGFMVEVSQFFEKDTVDYFVVGMQDTVSAEEIYHQLGVSWNRESMNKGLTREGTEYGDNLIGNGYADTIVGGAGDDQIIGLGGDDYLVGGAGRDGYIFSGDFGSDYIEAAPLGEGDFIQFTDIKPEDLWLNTNDGNLIITVLNTNNSVAIEGWVSNPENTVLWINLTDSNNPQNYTGSIVPDTSINNLVAAMNAIGMPENGLVHMTEMEHQSIKLMTEAAWGM